MKLLKELQNKIENETRPPEELYQEIKILGMQMYLTNSINKEAVLSMCSSLLKLYELLKEKDK